MNDYYYTDISTSNIERTLAAISGLFGFILLAISILYLICQIKIFVKAGRKWWEALIPIYNFVILIQIVNLPSWNILLFFIPIANIYIIIKIYIELAHKFGKTTGFGIAMIFFPYICFPILAFGKASYVGEVNNSINNNFTNQNIDFNNPIQPTITPVYQETPQPSYQQPMNQGFQETPQPSHQQPMNQGFQETPQPSYQQPINQGFQETPQPPFQQPMNQGFQETPQTDPNVKFCGNCGIQVGTTVSNCPNCGSNC